MFLSSRQRRHVKTSWISSAIFGTSQPPVKSPVVKDFSEAFNEMVVKHNKWLEWPNDIDSIFFNLVTCSPFGRTVQKTPFLSTEYLEATLKEAKSQNLRHWLNLAEPPIGGTWSEKTFTASLWDLAFEEFYMIPPRKHPKLNHDPILLVGFNSFRGYDSCARTLKWNMFEPWMCGPELDVDS